MTDENSFSARVRTFFIEPDTFFRDLAVQPPRYRWPLCIVLVAGIFSAVSAYLTMSWMFPFFSAGYSSMEAYPFISAFFGFILLFASALAVFGPLFAAIIAGFVFYILAGFVSKGGSLVHTITAMGWGIFPLAVYELVQIPLFLAYRSAMTVSISPEFFALMNNSTSAPSMDRETMMQMFTFSQPFYTYTMLNAGLHVAAWLCCAWFWIPAVRNTCAVERRQAALIVLVPLLVFLAVSYGPVLLSGGHVT
jgi:hypothetical protein